MTKLAIKSRGLYLGSLPLASKPPYDDEDANVQRRVHCRRYDNCLTHAASQGWAGFACHACDIDEPLSREDWQRDLEGLARLLRALSVGR